MDQKYPSPARMRGYCSCQGPDTSHDGGDWTRFVQCENCFNYQNDRKHQFDLKIKISNILKQLQTTLQSQVENIRCLQQTKELAPATNQDFIKQIMIMIEEQQEKKEVTMREMQRLQGIYSSYQ